MGAGGIGFDVAELITHAGVSASLDIDIFAREWGIDFKNHPRGGVTGVKPQVATSGREVWLMQRKTDTVGKYLGRTTGWTHRLTLQRRDVQMVSGVDYLKIDDAGLHTMVNGEPRLFDGRHDHRLRRPDAPAHAVRRVCRRHGVKATLVGGAFEAAELDAKRAIDQASRLAAAA